MSLLITDILLTLLAVTSALPHTRSPNLTDILASLEQLQVQTAQLLPAYSSNVLEAAALAGITNPEALLGNLNNNKPPQEGLTTVKKERVTAQTDQITTKSIPSKGNSGGPADGKQGTTKMTTTTPRPWFGQFHVAGAEMSAPQPSVKNDTKTVPKEPGTIIQDEIPPPSSIGTKHIVHYSKMPTQGPIHGGWTQWSEWAPCNATCDLGYRRRTRDCTNPHPANGGIDCYEHYEEFQVCYSSTPCPDTQPIDAMFLQDLSPFTQEEIRLTLELLAGQQHNQQPSVMKHNSSFEPDYKQQPNQIRSQIPLKPEQLQLTNKFKQLGPLDVNALTDMHNEIKQAYSTDPLSTGPQGNQAMNDLVVNQGITKGGHAMQNNLVFESTTSPSPQPGTWLLWTEWTWCDAPCGAGVQQRTRMCDTDPGAMFSGITCQGNDIQTRSCNVQPCQDPAGGWSIWLQWGPCDATCGTGMQVRIRLCNHPSGDPAACGGQDYESRPCDNPPCPVNGGWTKWSKWGKCDRVCGTGTSIRTRQCNNPVPAYGGLLCKGPDSESKKCNQQSCPVPVNGGWTMWSVWGKCDRPCGTGATVRTRQCTNPAPANGGALCQGQDNENKLCNQQSCIVPVDGGWTAWGVWGQCDRPCGPGKSTRTRQCSNPLPAYGGKFCKGPDNEIKTCNLKPCPVDGKWAQWSKWSPCDVICGQGTKTRVRKCIAPQHGGKNCQGKREETAPCIRGLCPINGGWTLWSEWTQCNKSCGRGMQTRTRDCSNPAPAHDGLPCDGRNTDFQPCNIRPCIVDGKWSVWTSWDQCDVSCGDGTQTRTRECNNPAPNVGGRDCIGYGRQMQSCSRGLCPVPISWAPWGQWGVCSAPCDIGLQRRQRVCNSTFIGKSGAECVGDTSDYRICMPGACADGSWSLWNNWSACSASCGTGTRSRARLCNTPAPSALGRYCVGEPSQTVTCSISKCQGELPSFTVEKPATILNGKLTFSHTIFNQGGAFSLLSGEFVCSRPGTYFFSMSLVKKRDFLRIDKVFCNLYRNNNTIVYVGVDPTDDDTDKGNALAHNAAVVHLNQGDVVSLQGCSDPPTYYMEEWSSFSGFLLRPDL